MNRIYFIGFLKAQKLNAAFTILGLQFNSFQVGVNRLYSTSGIEFAGVTAEHMADIMQERGLLA